MTPCLHIRRPAIADPKMAYTQSDPPGATPHRERSLTSTSVLLFCGGELTGNRASCNNAFHRLSGWSSARRLYYRSPLTDRQTVKKDRERERETDRDAGDCWTRLTCSQATSFWQVKQHSLLPQRHGLLSTQSYCAVRSRHYTRETWRCRVWCADVWATHCLCMAEVKFLRFWRANPPIPFPPSPLLSSRLRNRSSSFSPSLPFPPVLPPPSLKSRPLKSS